MENKIKDYIENTELTLHNIANRLGCSAKKVRNVWSRYSKKYRSTRKAKCYRNSKLGDNNPMTGKNGADHHNYIGLVGDSKGYLLVLKPEWYTGRKNSKHIFQHHEVVCKNLNITEIVKGYVVHHCDHNPHNNDFNNLVLLTMSDHTALHQYLGRSTTISKESTLKWVEARNTSKK